jgi:ADP-ribosylation factor GTPase-activating protein 1
LISVTSDTADQKAATEAYLENLGKINSNRPDNLPPSQGGRYSGFGYSPSPPEGSGVSQPSQESVALSSRNLPTMQDVTQNPMGAITKGWTIFSGAISGAGKAVNNSIIQPGIERVRAEAPGVQERIGTFAGEVHGMVKEKTGVDVQEGWGNFMDKMRDLNVGPSPSRRGYQGVSEDGWHDQAEETSALYRDDDGVDGEEFFGRYENASSANFKGIQITEQATSSKQMNLVEKEGWDDWKQF